MRNTLSGIIGNFKCNCASIVDKYSVIILKHCGFLSLSPAETFLFIQPPLIPVCSLIGPWVFFNGTSVLDMRHHSECQGEKRNSCCKKASCSQKEKESCCKGCGCIKRFESKSSMYWVIPTLPKGTWRKKQKLFGTKNYTLGKIRDKAVTSAKLKQFLTWGGCDICHACLLV